ELHLAEVTVKKHVQNVIQKLGVSDRIHAAVLAVKLGLVE
ncbi:MAG: response regulator transcription factor, partial [Gemmatimonadetes bacterium]|nr:response regulator transcription factor [Gemmatimonadota bacterium]